MQRVELRDGEIRELRERLADYASTRATSEDLSESERQDAEDISEDDLWIEEQQPEVRNFLLPWKLILKQITYSQANPSLSAKTLPSSTLPSTCHPSLRHLSRGRLETHRSNQKSNGPRLRATGLWIIRRKRKDASQVQATRMLHYFRRPWDWTRTADLRKARYSLETAVDGDLFSHVSKLSPVSISMPPLTTFCGGSIILILHVTCDRRTVAGVIRSRAQPHAKLDLAILCFFSLLSSALCIIPLSSVF